MRLGEGALALQRRRDRRLKQLGQLPELVPGLRIVDALARVDHRSLSVDQRLGRFASVGGIRTRSIRRRRRVVDRLLDLGAPEVAGDLQHDRSLPTVLRMRKRAPDGVRQVVGIGQLLGPLAHVLEVDQPREVRRNVGLRASVTAGNRDHRRRLAPGLSQTTERVFRTRTVLGQVHRDSVARVHPSKGVGNVNPRPLLANDDRADIGLSRRLKDRIDGIADHKVDALPLQHLSNRVRSSHLSAPLFSFAPPLGELPRSG